MNPQMALGSMIGLSIKGMLGQQSSQGLMQALGQVLLERRGIGPQPHMLIPLMTPMPTGTGHLLLSMVLLQQTVMQGKGSIQTHPKPLLLLSVNEHSRQNIGFRVALLVCYVF